MTAAERVARILSAANALAELPGSSIDVRPADEADFLELARVLGATVRGHSVIYADAPLLGAVWLYSFDVVRHGVTIHCQGTRPATPDEVEKADISEAALPVTPERRAAALAKLRGAR